MGEMIKITAEVDGTTLAALDQMAADQKLTREALLARIARDHVERMLEFRTFVQLGVDAADRGELIEQDEMERWFEARYGERAAAE